MSLKKLPIETILTIPGHITLDMVNFWFQDEASIGQQNTTTRLWANKGSRPRAVKQQQFEYVYLFGAVCPANGRTEALLAPCGIKTLWFDLREHWTRPSCSGDYGWCRLAYRWYSWGHKKPEYPQIASLFTGIECNWVGIGLAASTPFGQSEFRILRQYTQCLHYPWKGIFGDLKRVTQMCNRDWGKRKF